MDQRPFTYASVARVAALYKAAGIVDPLLRLFRPATVPGEGPTAAGAESLIAQCSLGPATDALLRQAVAAERLAGRTWEEIGALLEVPKQTAQWKFASAAEEFRAAVLTPGGPEGVSTAEGAFAGGAPYAARNPQQAAAHLDTWLIYLGIAATGQRPVTDLLVRMEPEEELEHIRRLRGRCWMGTARPAPQEVLKLTQWELRVLDTLVQRNPRALKRGRELADVRGEVAALEADLALGKPDSDGQFYAVHLLLDPGLYASGLTRLVTELRGVWPHPAPDAVTATPRSEGAARSTAIRLVLFASSPGTAVRTALSAVAGTTKRKRKLRVVEVKVEPLPGPVAVEVAR